MSVAAAGALKAVKHVLIWLLTTVAGKAVVKAFVPIILLALFLMGVYGLGLLPRSPFYYANDWLVGMGVAVPYTRYIGAFVPVGPISAIFSAWVMAVIKFHVAKFYLRKGGIIK